MKETGENKREVVGAFAWGGPDEDSICKDGGRSEFRAGDLGRGESLREGPRLEGYSPGCEGGQGGRGKGVRQDRAGGRRQVTYKGQLVTVITGAKSSSITAYVLRTLLSPQRHRGEGVGSVRRNPSLPGKRGTGATCRPELLEGETKEHGQV